MSNSDKSQSFEDQASKQTLQDTEVDSQKTYEEKITNSGVEGLLTLFHQKILNRNSDEKNQNEFETINVNTEVNIPQQSSKSNVSEDDINRLLSKTKKYPSDKLPTRKVSSESDIQTESVGDIKEDEILIQNKTKYTDVHSVVENKPKEEDAVVGYQPVNTNPQTDPSDQKPNTPVSQDRVEITKSSYTESSIGDDVVLKYIKEHRFNKDKTDELGEYIND